MVKEELSPCDSSLSESSNDGSSSRSFSRLAQGWESVHVRCGTRRRRRRRRSKSVETS